MAVLVGKKAPDFHAPAIMKDNSIQEDFHFYSHIAGKYAMLFFYPLDFTFVCPSEILAFDKRHKQFESHNCEVIAVSVDSHFTHLAWKNTPVRQGGIGALHYPMVADLKKEIATAYGILHEGAVALRGTFLVDREGIVRHQVVNDLPLGRNVDEAIRMLDALQYFESHGEVCPAGWKPGDPGMRADAKGVAEYLGEHHGKL